MLCKNPALVKLSGLAFSAIAIFGLLWMNISSSLYLIPGLLAATAILLIASYIIAQSDRFAIRISSKHNLLGHAPLLIVMFGIVLRIAFYLKYPANPTSDAAEYLKLAETMITEHIYRSDYGVAFWPPGLPFVLIPFLYLFEEYAGIALNLFSFLATAWVTYALCARLTNRAAACIALLILAIWPQFVASAALIQKEMLLIVLWPAAVLLYLRAGDYATGMRDLYSSGAGLTVGYSILTQPSCGLLPGVFILYNLCAEGVTLPMLRRTAAFCLCVCIVVVPWTIRNYHVLHHFVPVNTAGGSNFYMANYPGSDGNWNREGEIASMKLSSDEVERNRLGYSLGLENIKRQPLQFLSMALRKPLSMYGWDSGAMYWIFERGGQTDAQAYKLLTIANQLFYAMLLVLIAIFFFQFSSGNDDLLRYSLPLIFLYYPIVAHTFFEASARHRFGTMVFMAIFAAGAIRKKISVGLGMKNHPPLVIKLLT